MSKNKIEKHKDLHANLHANLQANDLRTFKSNFPTILLRFK